MSTSSMMEITVKTLDSQNHQFSVPEDMTVKDFKAEISPRIGIPVEQQRLIFRGRVLQDEKKLNECNVANNTVHVVIRPANASSNRSNDQPSRINNERGNAEGGQGGIIISGDGAGGRNAIIMGAIGIPTTIDIQAETGMSNSMGPRSVNSATFRLQVGNQMLGRASLLLRRLEDDDSIASAAAAAEGSTDETNSGAQNQHTEDTGNNSPMDIDLNDQNSFGRMISQVANAASTAAIVAAIRQVPGSNGNGTTPGPDHQSAGPGGNGTPTETATPPRPDAPRLREMATIIQDILAFQERLSPYLQFIQSTLRSNQLHETEELPSIQYVFDTISAILHLIGHSYHALSDITCDFATPPETRRLRAAASVLVEQSSVIRATIPIAVPTSMFSGNQPNSAPVNSNASQNPNASATGTATSGGTPQQSPGNGTPAPTPPSQFNFGGFGQPQINIGMVGQPQVSVAMSGQPQQINFGAPGQHHLNLGAMGQPQMSFTGGTQAGFTIPDLTALLGSGMAGGMMPIFMQANAAQGGRSGPISTTASTPINNPPTQPSTTSSATTPNVTARPQMGSNNNNGMAGNHMGMLNNLPMQIRNELSRPPFDILLNCHTHHGNRATSSRPANLSQFVNVDRPTTHVNVGSSEDFLLICAEVIRQSNLLNVLQPILCDVITNYLMRGRDVRNNDHIRSCGKSWAKKLTPFFDSFTEKLANRNQNVMYSETYTNLLTGFFTEILQLTLRTPVGPGYRDDVIRACEKFIEELMAVFKVCFSKCDGYIRLFVSAVVEKLVGGSSFIFREGAAKNLTDYLSGFALVGNESIDGKIVFKAEGQAVQQTAGAETGSVSNSSGIRGSPSESGVLPPKQARQTPGPGPSGRINMVADQRSLDEDIDDMINLIPPTRRPGTQISAETNNYETAMRNIPSEWVNTVRHDLHRQLGMPDQPPLSPGYIALLSRKP